MNKKRILFASFSHFVCDVNTGALPAVLPFLVSAHGLSYSMATGLMLANSSLASVIQPVFGLVSDRSPRAWHMPAGILIAGLGMAAAGFLESYAAIFLAVMVSGIGAAMFHPAGMRFANRVSGKSQGTGLSLFSVGGNAGYLLAPMLAVALVQPFGLRGLGFLAPLAACMAALMLYECLRLDIASGTQVTKGHGDGNREKTHPTNDWKAFSRLTGNIVCRSTVMVCLRAFIPLYWIARFGQTEAMAALALTVFGACGICSNIAGGILADRYGYRRVIRASHVLLVPLMAALPFVENFHLAFLLVMLLGSVLFAPFSSIIVLGQRYLARNTGFASGITLGLGISIGGIFAPVLGMVADLWGIEAALHILSACAIVGTLFTFLLPEPRNPQEDENNAQRVTA